MGYYITFANNGSYMPAQGKLDILISEGATIELVPVFQENLVCLVQEEGWQAVAYCHSESLFKQYRIDDGRPKMWLIVPNAAERSGFKRRPLVHQN